MMLALQALGYGFLSALSMPIGAIIGIVFAPIPEAVTAHAMAFGAGALVYAVSTELFGEALFELKFHRHRGEHHVRVCHEACQHEFTDMLTQSFCAVLGAVAYILLERWLSTLTPGSEGEPPQCGEEQEMEALAEQKADGEDHGGQGNASSTALAMWLGLLLDGIPESLMLGFMTKEGDLGFVLLISIFMANFPEAFSSAAILKSQGASVAKIMGMWLSILLITGVLAMIGCLILPDRVEVGSQADRVKSFSSAAAEGFTGGSMFAMIATAMLPEAFHHAGTKVGFTFVLGFVISVTISEFGVRFGGTEEFER